MASETTITETKSWRVSTRRGSLSIVLWAFGLATTLLLVGLWGRAVSHDQPTIQETAATVVNAQVATDRIHGWIEDGIVASSDIDPVVADQIVTALAKHPEVDAVMESIVDQVVGALFVETGETASLDLASTLEPLVPLVATNLAAFDIPVDEAALTSALTEAEPVELATEEVENLASAVDDARSFLSIIVVLAAVTMLVAGSLAIWLSENHVAMVRTLAIRVALSSLSFVVLFRMGSWVLDPDGGASPIAGGGAILLSSNAHVFLLVALVASAIVASVGWYLWRAKRGVQPTVDQDDSTVEMRDLVNV